MAAPSEARTSPRYACRLVVFGICTPWQNMVAFKCCRLASTLALLLTQLRLCSMQAVRLVTISCVCQMSWEAKVTSWLLSTGQATSVLAFFNDVFHRGPLKREKCAECRTHCHRIRRSRSWRTVLKDLLFCSSVCLVCYYFKNGLQFSFWDTLPLNELEQFLALKHRPHYVLQML